MFDGQPPPPPPQVAIINWPAYDPASLAEIRGAWSLRGGASLVDAEVQSDGPAIALDGLRPAQTPRVVLTAGVTWNHDGRAASVHVQHTSAQFEDDLNERKLAAATTVDGFFAWPLGRSLQLVARGENLLNQRVVAGLGSDGSIERATPRTLWLELRFRRPSGR